MVQQRRFAVISQNGDIRAVNRTAHVEAAGQRDAQLGRQTVVFEIVKEHVHGGLDRTGCIGGRCVAVNPSLGVHDVGDTGTGAAHGELEAAAGKLAAFEVINQRFDFGLVVHQKFDVVTGGKPQVPVTMFFGNFADLTNMGGAHEAGTANPYGVDLVAGFGHVVVDTGLGDFVIQPLALIFSDDRRIKIIEFPRADVADSVFHRFVRIIT